MKVCFLTDNNEQLGGRQAVTARIVNAFAEVPEFEVSVAYTAKDAHTQQPTYPLAENVKVLDSQVIQVGQYAYFGHKLIRVLNKKFGVINRTEALRALYFPKTERQAYQTFFADHDFDVVIGVGPRMAAMLTELEIKAKKWLWCHCDYQLYFRTPGVFQWQQERLYQQMLPKLDRVIVQTNQDARAYQANMNLDAWVIPNPLNSSQSSPSSTLDHRRVLFVGRLEYDVKGLDRLVLIMSALHAKAPDIQLTIVGNGDGRNRLLHAITAADLGDVVEFAGFRREVSPYYLRADCLLQTSRAEAFGLVITEAFEYGVPVVAFKTVGASDIIHQGREGYLIEQDDIQAYVEALLRLMQDDRQRVAMGAQAKKRAADYQMTKILPQWLQLLKQ